MRFLLGVATALVLLIGAGLAVVWTGACDVAATDRHADPIRWALDTTMANSVSRRVHEAPPEPFSEEKARKGFSSFDGMCVHCHGAPGVEPAAWAEGLWPSPPDLSRHVSHWSRSELFWIVKQGIKMPGMPGMPALAPTDDDSRSGRSSPSSSSCLTCMPGPMRNSVRPRMLVTMAGPAIPFPAATAMAASKATEARRRARLQRTSRRPPRRDPLPGAPSSRYACAEIGG